MSYSRRHANFPGDFTGLGDNTGFGGGDFTDRSINLAVSETHAFSTTLINEARFGYSRLRTSSQPASALVSGVPAQFGIQGIPQTAENGGLPTIAISGLTNLGAGAFASPNRRSSDTIQFTENLTKVHGGHSFKGGFEYQSDCNIFPWKLTAQLGPVASSILEAIRGWLRALVVPPPAAWARPISC